MILRLRPLLLFLSFLAAAEGADQRSELMELASALEEQPETATRLLQLLNPESPPPAAEAAACTKAILGLLEKCDDPDSIRHKKSPVCRKPLCDAVSSLYLLDPKAFAQVLGSRRDQWSALAADALDTMGSRAEAWALAEGLCHRLPQVRAQSASLLGRARVRKASGRLAELLAADPSDDVREMCARSLSRIGGDVEVPALSKASRDDKSNRVRRAATLALGWLGTRDAGDALFENLQGGGIPPGTQEALRILSGKRSGGDSLQEARISWEKHRPEKGYEVFDEFDEVTYRGKGKGKRRCERKRALYLFDCTGSIPNHREWQRKYAALLEGVPEETYFDVIAFSTNPQPWRGILVSAERKKTRAAAAGWIQGFDGWSGSTALSATLRMALLDYDVDEIILCTDGGGNMGVQGKDTFNYVQAFNACRRVRIVGIPVGNLCRNSDALKALPVPVDLKHRESTLGRLVEESGGRVVEDGLKQWQDEAAKNLKAGLRD